MGHTLNVAAGAAVLAMAAIGGTASAGLPFDYCVDHTVEEIDVWMDDFVALFNPGSCDCPISSTVEEYGTSYEDRSIRALTLVGQGSQPKPAFLLIGGNYAREWPAVSTLLWLGDYMASNYGTFGDDRVNAVLDAYDVIIIPIMNPDGYAFSGTPGQRAWIKNRRLNDGSCIGVNLDRNWDSCWGVTPGSSALPCSHDYHGSAPFSEPETQCLRDFILGREIAGVVDLRAIPFIVGESSFSGAAVFPFTSSCTAAGPCLDSIAAAMQTTYGGLVTGTFEELFGSTATGSMIDWCYVGGIPSIQLYPRQDEGWNNCDVCPLSVDLILAFMAAVADRCPADIDGDLEVDVIDLVAVITSWGPCSGCLADTNCDETVDVNDLLMVINDWGPCP